MHTVDFKNRVVNYTFIFDAVISNGGKLELVVGNNAYQRMDLHMEDAK